MTTHGYLLVKAVLRLRSTRDRTVTLARECDVTPEQAAEIVEEWRLREPDMTIIGHLVMSVV